jgi:hypothetical protein
MSMLKITTREARIAFQPGEKLEGGAYWSMDRAPKSVTVNLLWFTRGKGTVDSEIVNSVEFDAPQQEEGREFSFQLPMEPYSFSGKLITLTWAVELLVEPGDNSERFEFTMAPGGAEVQLNKPLADDARRA